MSEYRVFPGYESWNNYGTDLELFLKENILREEGSFYSDNNNCLEARQDRLAASFAKLLTFLYEKKLLSLEEMFAHCNLSQTQIASLKVDRKC